MIRTLCPCQPCFFALRVCAAFLAASRRIRVSAAFAPACRRLRVRAAFLPASLRFSANVFSATGNSFAGKTRTALVSERNGDHNEGMPRRSSKKQADEPIPAETVSAEQAPADGGKNPAAVALGRLGGKKGGWARAADWA